MKRLSAASMLAIMASSPAAFAQAAPGGLAQPAPQSPVPESPVSESPAPQSTDSGGVADIIVTANKRAQSLQDTPVAVTPISQDRLQSLNVVAVSDIAQVAPSISFIASPTPQSSQFVIRGVGTFAANDALEQSVGVVIDGIPMARLGGSLTDTVDVSQVQVLRGPQGTLFGKNATAGVISIDYQNATFEPSKSIRLLVGSHAELRGQATVNAPLSDSVAVRLSGWYSRRDGYIDAVNQRDGDLGDFVNRGVRAKVAILPTSNWRIDLTGEYSRNWGDGSLQTIRGYLPLARDRIIQQVDLSQGVVAGPDNLSTSKDFPENSVIEQWRSAVNSTTSFGDIDLTAIVGYVKTKTDNIMDTDFTDSRTFAQGSVTHYSSDLEQFTVETRISNTDKGPLQYTAGLFYYKFDESANQNAANLLTTALPSALTSFDQQIGIHTRTYAAFGDISYDIGQVRLMAGGRYSHETSNGTYVRRASREFVRPNILFGAVSLVNPDNVYKDFSWRVGAQWRPTERVMVYATANRAYKGPGFNYTLNISPAQFSVNQGVIDAEIAKSYEIGMRSEFFDRQMTFNLTGFYSPFSNFQVTSVLPTVPPSLSTVNAPELLAKGVELEFAVHPRALPGFTFDGSVVYNDTSYSDFPAAPCYVGQPQAAAPTSAVGVCAPVAVGSTLFVQNVTGLRSVGAPEWQTNLTARYEAPVSNRLKAFGQVNFTYQTKVQFSVGEPSETIQKAYGIVNLAAGIGDEDDAWRLSVYLKNATNQRFSTRILQSNPSITQTIPFQALRTVAVALDVKF